MNTIPGICPHGYSGAVFVAQVTRQVHRFIANLKRRILR